MRYSLYGFLPIVIIIFFTAFYAWAGINRHHFFESNAYDLGIFTQVVWHYGNGEIPESSIREIDNIFKDHFQPFLLLLIPFTWTGSIPTTLILLQALVFGSGAIPLFLLAKKRLQSITLASAILFPYFLYTGTQHALLFDIHPIVFAAGLIPWAIFFFFHKRYILYSLLIILILSTKESIGITMGTLSLVFCIATKEKQRIMAFVSFILCVLYSIIIIHSVIPRINGNGYLYISSYTNLGATSRDIITTIILHPLQIMRSLTDNEIKRQTITTSLKTFSWLPVASPLILLATIPTIFQQLLVKPELRMLWNIAFHYYAILAPLCAYATITTLSKIEKWANRKKWRSKIAINKRHKLAKNICALCIVLISITTQLTNESPFIQTVKNNTTPTYAKRLSIKNNIEQSLTLAAIPTGASITATDAIVPHLANRKAITLLDPKQCFNATPRIDSKYIIISTSKPHWPLSTNELEETIHNMVRWQSYDLIIQNDDIMIFKQHYGKKN